MVADLPALIRWRWPEADLGPNGDTAVGGIPPRIVLWPERLGQCPSEADLEILAQSPGYLAQVLRLAQDARAAEIDARTAELLKDGFEWPADSGKRFALTDRSVGIWNGLMAAALAGVLEYPVEDVGVIEDGTISLLTQEQVVGFCRAALARGRYIHTEAARITKLVYAAETVEAVAAVADNRE